MTTKTIKISKKEAAPFMEAAGIEYSGRKFKLELTEKITFSDLNWGGGTRNTYEILSMETSESRRLLAPAPWNNPREGQTITIPAGFVIVEHSIFCGHDMGIRLYANPTQAKLIAGGVA